LANEHIGRKQSIGLGKESTPGTGVSAAIWIPKSSGVFTPKVDTAVNDGAYGVIDAVRDVQAVKNMTEISFQARAQSTFLGHLLMAAFGTAYATVRIPIPGSITGTYVEGETITESTSSATGVLRRLDAGGSVKALYIAPSSGTFTGGQTLTGGTSGATATGGTIESPSAVRHHVFRVANTNTHPSYSVYGIDPVSTDRALYCLLDTLEIECVVGNFVNVSAKFMGRKLASTSGTVSFSTEYPFLAKAAVFKYASAFTGLDAASAVAVESFRLTINKNVTDYTAFGDTDPESFHNQEFGEVTGEITLLYNVVTERDYVIDSTKRAMRFTVTNPVTIGSAANPLFQLDMPSVGFREFSRSSENPNLVKQTLRFTAEYDVTRALTIEALLANTQTTAY
jgi:hypothetical protein